MIKKPIRLKQGCVHLAVFDVIMAGVFVVSVNNLQDGVWVFFLEASILCHTPTLAGGCPIKNAYAFVIMVRIIQLKTIKSSSHFERGRFNDISKDENKI